MNKIKATQSKNIQLTKLLVMRKVTSVNFENEMLLNDFCNASKTLALISGRWKLSLLFALQENALTYSEFKKILPTVSDRVLSLQLKQLQDDLLLIKEKRGENTFYTLTNKGKGLHKIVTLLSNYDLNTAP